MYTITWEDEQELWFPTLQPSTDWSVLSLPDAGSWPDWIAALVAALAFGVAAVAAWATVQTNRAQQQQLADIQRVERERQANAFAVWLDAGPNLVARYRISNQSGQPVLNFVAWWIDDIERGRPRWVHIIPPGEWWIFETEPWSRTPMSLGLSEEESLPIDYTFTDQRQTNWKRHHDGKLTEEVREWTTWELKSALHPEVDGEMWWNRATP